MRRLLRPAGGASVPTLDALKLGLLSGTLETRAPAALKAAAAELADRTGEPNLDTLLAEIELRVGVELAKIGMPPKDASFRLAAAPRLVFRALPPGARPSLPLIVRSCPAQARPI